MQIEKIKNKEFVVKDILTKYPKARFGSHTVEKRPRGYRGNGLWEYRLIINKEKE